MAGRHGKVPHLLLRNRPMTLRAHSHYRRAWLVLALVLCGSAAAADPAYWQDTAARSPLIEGTAPDRLRTIRLDWPSLRSSLGASAAGTRIALPAPDGGYAEFALADSGTLPAALAARYPQIRSYVGTAADGTQARIDLSPIGLNAMVFARDGLWIVRPETFGEGPYYLSFHRSALTRPDAFRCSVEDADAAMPLAIDLPAGGPVPTGATRRDYRLAVAANRPYVAAIAGANPPTVAAGLAAVTVAINRVNQVYERDFSIHLTLVPDNDRIIYTDAATDPYTNGDGAIDQNTANLDAVIGSANYDLGHVFTTRSGVAGLGVICTSDKGAGTTGLSASRLQSDAFYIDYVAHEIGHQLGGRHSFNSTVSNCGPPNRSAGSAYEPGSGSTIMAYAGICGAANLQPNSDPYFHARSLEEITLRTGSAAISACGAPVANPSAPPVVPALTGRTIPARTPYALTGSAFGAAAGAQLTYAWEQYDLGPANNALETDPGSGPIQRSFEPTASPTRYLPRLATLLGDGPAFGEILPATTRTLTYRLTVRDNLAAGGSTGGNELSLSVIDTGRPFAVTEPTAATTWQFTGTPAPQTVLWDTAATEAPPIACASVDIDLVVANETDLVPVAVLARAAPNTGSAVIEVPNVDRPAARVRVRCADNVFFNLSPAFAVAGIDALFADGFGD